MVGRCISYWNSPFLGDMLVFRGVDNKHQRRRWKKHDNDKPEQISILSHIWKDNDYGLKFTPLDSPMLFEKYILSFCDSCFFFQKFVCPLGKVHHYGHYHLPAIFWFPCCHGFFQATNRPVIFPGGFESPKKYWQQHLGRSCRGSYFHSPSICCLKIFGVRSLKPKPTYGLPFESSPKTDGPKSIISEIRDPHPEIHFELQDSNLYVWRFHIPCINCLLKEVTWPSEWSFHRIRTVQCLVVLVGVSGNEKPFHSTAWIFLLTNALHPMVRLEGSLIKRQLPADSKRSVASCCQKTDSNWMGLAGSHEPEGFLRCAVHIIYCIHTVYTPKKKPVKISEWS